MSSNGEHDASKIITEVFPLLPAALPTLYGYQLITQTGGENVP